MKKIYTFIFLLPAFISSAQVTLTMAVHGYDPGTVQLSYDADTALYTPGGSGASQTWDFSGLNISGAAYTINYVTPSSTPYAASFAGSTVASGDGSGTYTFYTQTPADLSTGGSCDGTNTIVYSNPEVLLKFPFAYGNSNTDTYSGSYSGVTTTGTMALNADAYGTLILSSGSYNTLRVKSVENYTDAFGSVAINVNVTLYSWYTATDRYPILQYAILNESGAASQYYKGISVSSAAVGINELSKEDNFLNVYPNPAHNVCTLNYSLDTPSAVAVSVTDVLGKELMNVNEGTQAAGSQTETIDLSTISAGIYFVKLTYGNKSTYKKIQVN